MRIKYSILISIFLAVTLLLCYLLQVLDSSVAIEYYTVIMTVSAILFYLGTWLWFCPFIIRFLLQAIAAMTIMMCIITRMVGYNLHYDQKEYIWYGFCVAIITCILAILAAVCMVLTDKTEKSRKIITKKIQSRIVISVLFTCIFILFYFRMANTWSGWYIMAGYKAILIVAALLFYLGTWLWLCTPMVRLLSQLTAVTVIVHHCSILLRCSGTGRWAGNVLWDSVRSIYRTSKESDGGKKNRN